MWYVKTYFITDNMTENKVAPVPVVWTEKSLEDARKIVEGAMRTAHAQNVNPRKPSAPTPTKWFVTNIRSRV